MKKHSREKKKAFIFLITIALLFTYSSAQEGAKQKYYHYYFLLDTSGSMKETAPGATVPTKIKLQESLTEFMPQLQANTQLSIYTFDKGIQQFMHFTIQEDRKALLDFVNSLEFEGKKTYAWQSLDYVIKESKKDFETDPNSIPIIMMLTDGKDETDWTLAQVLEPFKGLHRVNNDSQLFIITLNFKLDPPPSPEDLPNGVKIENVAPSEPIPSPLMVRFDWWPLSPKVDEKVLFINRTSPTKESYAYSWKIGDDFKSTDPELVHVFSNPGSYKVSLKVTDAERADTYQKTIEVGLDISPIFTVSKRIGRAPLKVKIKNQATGNITD